jgi:hypothetical protein
MLKIGKYQHYKNMQYYQVLHVGKHVDTHEDFVVYESLYGNHQIWIRPLAVFLDSVEYDGKQQPRFSLVEEEM